jgi:hypothetical protein
VAYCTVSDVNAYLGISTSGDHTLIADMIRHAQTAIESYTQRIFEAQSDTTRTFDADRDVCNEVLYFDHDIISITTVTNGDGATVASTKYVTEPRNYTPYYAIRLKVSSGLIWEYDSSDDPEDAISVAGRWAFSTTPPHDIVQSCIRLSSYFYRQKDAQVFDVTATPELGVITVPKGIPADVKIMLDPYRRRF